MSTRVKEAHVKGETNPLASDNAQRFPINGITPPQSLVQQTSQHYLFL